MKCTHHLPKVVKKAPLRYFVDPNVTAFPMAIVPAIISLRDDNVGVNIGKKVEYVGILHGPIT
jgi:hypothetical protein